MEEAEDRQPAMILIDSHFAVYRNRWRVLARVFKVLELPEAVLAGLRNPRVQPSLLHEVDDHVRDGFHNLA